MAHVPGPSPPAYLYKTPQTASHAPHTPLAFSPGFPPHHPHALFLHPPYTAAPGALPRSGYPHPFAPHPPYPLPPHPHRPYLHKDSPSSTLTEPDPEPDLPTMAITLYATRTQPDAAAAAAAALASSSGAGSGSDGGREPTPPGEERQRQKDAKKKIHNCWMCHKSFDRPSTLKKHLLVHTGEKAFACESCGRRFGVASNLNRHAKTCRAAHQAGAAGSSAAAPATGSPSAQAAGASPSTSSDAGAAPVASTSALAPLASASADTYIAPAPAPIPAPAPQRRTSRKRKTSAPDDTSLTAPMADPSQSSSSASTTQSSEAARLRRKRARRAPSPSVWVPESLQAFDLTPVEKGTPVPLPPVRPLQEHNQLVEERDSFDENASATPYHPRGWSGRLPGPGLSAANVANRAGGQLLIF